MADGHPSSTALTVAHANAAPAEITFDQMERMADSFAKSNLFGVKTKDAALSLLMIAQAEGIHPALAVMEYDIIEGKPARKAERLLARFQMSGGKVEWLTYTDEEVTARFSHPMGSDVTVDWTMEKARKVSYYARGTNGDQGRWKPLADKYNWKNWPRAMLRSRCIAEGVRACFPGASLVTLTSEEAQDLGEPIEARVIDRTGDADQRLVNERSGPMIGKPARDAFDDLAQRMFESEDAAALEIVFDEAEKANLSQNRMFALAEYYEACKEAHETGKPAPAPPRFAEAPEPSPFAKLKADAEAIGDDAEKRKAWLQSITADVIGKCSEQERTELKRLYASMKSGAGAATRTDADAGESNTGAPGGASSPAPASPFEALKEQGLAVLTKEGKRRQKAAFTEWLEALVIGKPKCSPMEQRELETVQANIAKEIGA